MCPSLLRVAATVVAAFTFALCAVFHASVASAADAPAPAAERDIVIYGGTSAGIAAAVQAKRMGKSVIIVEPTERIGGLTTGGLGATDIGNKRVIGGISREFYKAVRKHYADPAAWKWQKPGTYKSSGQAATAQGEEAMWTFEPSVALKIYEDWVRRDGIEVVRRERLQRSSAGVVFAGGGNGRRLAAIRTESGREFRGKMFIDATYEGDLLALSGVSYTVGREANAQYGETLNGVQTHNARHHQFRAGVDPYVRKGDSSSGLLPFIDPAGPGKEGAADRRVQAYCYRMCLTNHPDNRIPFAKPDGYREDWYELLLRDFEAGRDKSRVWINSQMPNLKTDTNNNGGFSTDFIGQNYDYPEADYKTREQIAKRHLLYQQGLVWTLANHPRVPASVRAVVSKWGVCKDEFTNNGGWPTQLYIREARRMVSAFVMTQHHCQGRKNADAESVGMAAYTMDSHHVQRHVDAKGHVRNEGDVQVGGFSPYAIGYRAIVPRSGECDNLLVPVCLSASHIAYGSIRMEPVFMVLGQSAATAAAIAIGDGTTVQDVDRAKLRKRLLADGQVLEWAAVKASASAAAAKTAAAAKAAKDAAKGWAQVQLPPDKRKAPAVAFAVPTLPAVAHRGASRDFPENTLAAFKGAFAAGAHGCEFDVRRTKDGRLVIIHDATFNRTSDVATPGRNGKPQSVKVASVTFEELRRHDAGVGKNKKFAGEKIPSLEETLALFKDVSCRPVVEIKEEGMEAEVVAALKAAGLLERAVVISFSKTVVRKLCKLEPRLTVGWLWGGNYKAPRAVVADALNRAALDLGTPILDISHGALSEALVADLRARGFTIWAWTVDDPARMAQLLSWGVESITTNRPDVLATVLRERAGKQAK